MDFLAGTLFGVGITGFFGCLFFPGAIYQMAYRIQTLEIAVDRLADKKSAREGDWWREGVPYDDGDE